MSRIGRPPADHIRDEIETRGWRPAELARRMGRYDVTGLIGGTEPVTAETAERLAAAFGTSVELWRRLAGLE